MSHKMCCGQHYWKVLADFVGYLPSGIKLPVFRMRTNDTLSVKMKTRFNFIVCTRKNLVGVKFTIYC